MQQTYNKYPFPLQDSNWASWRRRPRWLSWK